MDQGRNKPNTVSQIAVHFANIETQLVQAQSSSRGFNVTIETQLVQAQSSSRGFNVTNKVTLQDAFSECNT